MPKPDTEIEQTFDKDRLFMIRLSDDFTTARRRLDSIHANWTSVDELTKQESLARIHSLIAIDLYERIRALMQPRGALSEFEEDIDKTVRRMEVPLGDPRYYSTVITLYYHLLADYQRWLDMKGILLENQPPDLFMDDVIRGMAQEKAARRSTRARR